MLAGGLGFEPRLTESESAVLPLNYPPRTSTSSAGRLRHSSAAFCTARGQTLQEADPGWCDPSERPYSNELPLSPRPDLHLRRYTPGAWTAAVAERNAHSPLLRICEPARSSRSFRGSLCPSEGLGSLDFCSRFGLGTASDIHFEVVLDARANRCPILVNHSLPTPACAPGDGFEPSLKKGSPSTRASALRCRGSM